MSYTPREEFCIDCKKFFIKKHAKTIRCPECQKAYNKMRQKELYEVKAKRAATVREKDPHVCTRIKSCKYGGHTSTLISCDYMLITGHKRPCPVKGCTEYTRKGRKNEKGKSGII